MYSLEQPESRAWTTSATGTRIHCWWECWQYSHLEDSWAVSYHTKVNVKSLSRVQLFATPWTVAYQAPPFSRQDHWSGLPFPSPGDLPDVGIEPRSPALQADSLPSEPFSLNTLNTLLSYGPAIVLLGIHSKELSTYVHTKSGTWMFTAVLLIIANTWKQPRYSSLGECINKLWYKQWNIIQL